MESPQKTVALNQRLDQIVLRDLYRKFHPNAIEYTFFSSAHGTLSRIDHMLEHKTKKTNYIKHVFRSNEMKQNHLQEENWKSHK